MLMLASPGSSPALPHATHSGGICASPVCVQALVLLQHLRSVSGRQASLQPHRLKFIVCFVLCVGACVGMAALLAWHLYLLSAGQVCGTCIPLTSLHRPWVHV